MKPYTIPMAITDFIPVFFFVISAIMLQRDLYNKMSAIAFAIFSAGTINVICAGSCKALYKLLYSLQICDMEALNYVFFPMQSLGFLLSGLGMLSLLFKRKSGAVFSVAPPLFKGTPIFITFMCLGFSLFYVVLCVLSVKLKKSCTIILFVLSFVCSLFMGYLSTKNFSLAYINWLAQCTNIVGQGLLMWGVIVLHKAGLHTLSIQ